MSIALTAVIRTRGFAILGVTVITELVILVWFYQKTSESSDPHLMEVLPLPAIVSLALLPVIALSAFGFVSLGIRFWASRTEPRNRGEDSKPSQ